MKESGITIRHSIFIAKPREVVWDYSQNYDNRTLWDPSVLEATVLQSTPNRIVKLKMRGNTTMTFVYKLDERPSRTTLVAKEIKSAIIERAGGSWSYEEKNGGTLWTQTNSIELKNNFFARTIQPLLKLILLRQTKQAMKKLKNILEEKD